MKALLTKDNLKNAALWLLSLSLVYLLPSEAYTQTAHNYTAWQTLQQILNANDPEQIQSVTLGELTFAPGDTVSGLRQIVWSPDVDRFIQINPLHLNDYRSVPLDSNALVPSIVEVVQLIAGSPYEGQVWQFRRVGRSNVFAPFFFDEQQGRFRRVPGRPDFEGDIRDVFYGPKPSPQSRLREQIREKQKDKNKTRTKRRIK